MIRYDRLGVGMSGRMLNDSDLSTTARRDSCCDTGTLGSWSRLLGDIFLGGADADEHEFSAACGARRRRRSRAAAVLALVYRLDVRGLLAHIRSPTLVVHRRDDRGVPYRLGREVAATIQGVTFSSH